MFSISIGHFKYNGALNNIVIGAGFHLVYVIIEEMYQDYIDVIFVLILGKKNDITDLAVDWGLARTTIEPFTLIRRHCGW